SHSPSPTLPRRMNTLLNRDCCNPCQPRVGFRRGRNQQMPTRSGRTFSLKSTALAGMAAALSSLAGTPAAAQETIRIGLPTKTYYPTTIAETALRQGLFAKEGIKAELTIYRSGGETFEAAAAGAADLQLNSAALIAAGRTKGVLTKAVAGAALGY